MFCKHIISVTSLPTFVILIGDVTQTLERFHADSSKETFDESASKTFVNALVT